MCGAGGSETKYSKMARCFGCACLVLLLVSIIRHGNASVLRHRIRGTEPTATYSTEELDQIKLSRTAKTLIAGHDPFSIDYTDSHSADAGHYWEYGTCATSSAWNVPNFGARWPLATGTVNWYTRIEAKGQLEENKAGGEDTSAGGGSGDPAVAYVPETVYAVLNQAYLSIFTSSHDAKMCNKPQLVIDTKSIHSAGRGGEPVLITQQNAEMQEGENPTFCVHLGMLNTEGPVAKTKIFCMADRQLRSDFISYLNNIIDGLKTSKRSIENVQAHETRPRQREGDLFPQPPRTICKGASPTEICLTSMLVDDLADESGEVDDSVQSCCKTATAECLACTEGRSILDFCKENPSIVGCNAEVSDEALRGAGTTVSNNIADHQRSRDTIVLAPAIWVGSFPVRAKKEQTWSVSGVSNTGTVTICQKSSHDSSLLDQEPNADMCLSVRKSTSMPGMVDLPIRKFTECPGEDLRCFEVPDVVVRQSPSAKDTVACSKACKEDAKCNGWVQTRPDVTGNGKAKCCLKAEDTSSECKASRCCDSHMKSMTKPGVVQLDPSANPKLTGVIELDEKVRVLLLGM